MQRFEAVLLCSWLNRWDLTFPSPLGSLRVSIHGVESVETHEPEKLLS